MTKAKWLNVAKKCVLMMLVMCCLCATVVQAKSKPAEKQVQIPVQSEEYKKGGALATEGKFEEALSFYKRGAEKGDPWCINAVGFYYGNGRGGLERDDRRAVELVRKAADLNCPEAIHNLGFYYLIGKGNLRKDSKKGIELTKRAAELNFPLSNYDMGYYYLTGNHGLRKDDKLGIEWLTKAANLNHPRALYELGGFYLRGEHGLPKDIKKWTDLMTKAGELGYVDAIYNLGWTYFEGKHGVPEDPKKGLELLTKAAELNSPLANYDLGCYYEEGKYVKKNLQTALAYYRRAKELRVGNVDDKKIASLERQVANEKMTAAGILSVASPSDIVGEYEANQFAADNKYKGKTVRIERGNVVEIGKNNNGNPYVAINTDMTALKNSTRYQTGMLGAMHSAAVETEQMYVLCVFDKGNANDVMALRKGAEAAFQGKVVGLTQANVVLFTNCRVVK